MSDQPHFPEPPPEPTPIPPPPIVEPSAERGAEATPTEPQDAARQSRAPIVVGILLVLALVGAVAGVWTWVATPLPCQNADLTSERFGYCATMPDGWQLAESRSQLTSDELVRPDAAATITIQAVDTRRGLDAFVSDLRASEDKEGTRPGPVRSSTVAGAAARQWDASSFGSIASRDVVFARNGIVWRIQFADSQSSFDRDVTALASIVRSWRFA